MKITQKRTLHRTCKQKLKNMVHHGSCDKLKWYRMTLECLRNRICCHIICYTFPLDNLTHAQICDTVIWVWKNSLFSRNRCIFHIFARWSWVCSFTIIFRLNFAVVAEKMDKTIPDHIFMVDNFMFMMKTWIDASLHRHF